MELTSAIIKNKKSYNFLIFACALVWVIMMGSKNIYTAEYIEIGNLFNVSKPQASLAMTFYFITYSAVQVLLFFYMGKVNIKWYMLISTVLSGVVTVIVALATELWQLWWILAINGILQAGVWGMCTAVLDKYLPITMKSKANMIMNIGTAASGIISYGSASLFVSFKTLASPFTFFGIILSISAIIFYIAVNNCSKLHKENQKNIKDNQVETATVSEQKQSLPFTLKTSKRRTIFYIATFILSVVAHFVFYGALNWNPSMLEENFNLKTEIATIISVLAPLATTIGPVIAIYHCEKHSNFIYVGLSYSLVASIFALIMMFVYNVNIILSLGVLILYLIVLQGLVTIIFSVISYKLSQYINAGAHSGLMNAAGGISAGIAPPIFGAIIEGASWQINYLVIFGISIAIAATSAVILYLLKNKKLNKN